MNLFSGTSIFADLLQFDVTVVVEDKLCFFRKFFG